MEDESANIRKFQKYKTITIDLISVCFLKIWKLIKCLCCVVFMYMVLHKNKLFSSKTFNNLWRATLHHFKRMNYKLSSLKMSLDFFALKWTVFSFLFTGVLYNSHFYKGHGIFIMNNLKKIIDIIICFRCDFDKMR